MRIILKNKSTGTLVKFANKDDLYEFAKKKLASNVFGDNEYIDKVKMEIKKISVFELCEALKGSYERMYEG